MGRRWTAFRLLSFCATFVITAYTAAPPGQGSFSLAADGRRIMVAVPPHGFGFDTLAFGSAVTGCAAGPNHIICTANAGHTWRTSYMTPATMTQLQFVAATVGWAVTPNLLLSTTTGGHSWRNAARIPGLRAIDFVTARDGWAVSAKGLLETHTGGARWMAVSTPVSVRAIDFLTMRIGWLLGPKGEVFHTTTGGRTWTRQWTVPIGGSWTSGRAQLSFTTSTTGWVLLTLGQACQSQEPYVVYHTQDGGRHWTLVMNGPSACGGENYPLRPLGLSGYPGNLATLGARTAWLVVISPAAATLSVAETSDGGQTWIQKRGTLPITLQTTAAIDFVDLHRGWIATGGGPYRGFIASTSDDGRTWVRQL